MSEVYKNIKRVRLKRGYSQTQLAELTGYKDKTAISHIEQGKRKLTPDKVVIFANALGVSPMELMGWDVETNKADILAALMDDAIFNILVELLEQYKKRDDAGKEKIRHFISDYTDLLKWS